MYLKGQFFCQVFTFFSVVFRENEDDHEKFKIDRKGPGMYRTLNKVKTKKEAVERFVID